MPPLGGARPGRDEGSLWASRVERPRCSESRLHSVPEVFIDEAQLSEFPSHPLTLGPLEAAFSPGLVVLDPLASGSTRTPRDRSD